MERRLYVWGMRLGEDCVLCCVCHCGAGGVVVGSQQRKKKPGHHATPPLCLAKVATLANLSRILLGAQVCAVFADLAVLAWWCMRFLPLFGLLEAL